MSSELNIITLNVQGFKDIHKQQEVVFWARSRKCDVLLLQETNFTCYKDVKQFETNNNVKSFFSFGTRRSEGVGIIIFNKNIVEKCSFHCDTEGRVMCVKFPHNGQMLKIVNVYAPASRKYVNSFFKNLDVFLLDKVPVVVAGDFNCVLDSDRDCRGAITRRPKWHARELRRIVEDFDLHDAWLTKHPNIQGFTWSRGSAASRLDRFYLSSSLSKTFPRFAWAAYLPPKVTYRTIFQLS